jgi:hypothetical protein
MGEDAEYRARVRRAIKKPIPHAVALLATWATRPEMCPVR